MNVEERFFKITSQASKDGLKEILLPESAREGIALSINTFVPAEVKIELHARAKEKKKVIEEDSDFGVQ